MTALLSRRRSNDSDVAVAAPEEEDLSHLGIHRDATAHDPIATGSFAQRMVNKVSGMLGRSRTSRRSFLTRTAVVGSALAVGPLDFILKPGTAYGYLCGTCTDGWTAFCCTVNSGRNSCPAGSFVAGWWKADNAAYCCGSARYIIDCNATCPTQCSCRCGGGSCDNRRTCCNQFRYGQCNTHIACYGPVVCRVAICTPPWTWDPSCTTTVRTDNRTTDHGAPCLTKDCGPASTPISRKYAQMGGSRGVLGAPVQGEHGLPDGRGRRARYANGNIYWTSATGAREVHGSIFREYGRQGGFGGTLRYPITDTRTDGLRRTRYVNFERGRIYSFISNAATVTVPEPFFTKHESMFGVRGVLGYPRYNVRSSSDGRSRYLDFENGRIYLRDGGLVEVHGSVFRHHEAQGGVHGPLGYPVNELSPMPDGRGRSMWFERGILWNTPTTGSHALYGPILDRYAANNHALGYIRYPTSGVRQVGDGRGQFATFEKGNIYNSASSGAHQVHGAVLRYYLARGGPTGSLGYPTSELDPGGTPGGRFQQFEGGRIEYVPATDSVRPA